VKGGRKDNGPSPGHDSVRELGFAFVQKRGLALAVGLGFALLVVLGASAGASPVTSCPGSDRTVPRTTVAGATRELVPAGATSLLLCRYRGLNPYRKRFRLLGSGTVRAASKVAHLGAQLNALKVGGSGPIACPADDGSLIVAYFRYRDGSRDVVRIGTTGCEVVSNGPVNRWAAVAPGPQLLTELDALTS
jgi:hypothetical protein